MPSLLYIGTSNLIVSFLKIFSQKENMVVLVNVKIFFSETIVFSGVPHTFMFTEWHLEMATQNSQAGNILEIIFHYEKWSLEISSKDRESSG
jgi:hypothetical protein